jgi:hypothetical protein
MVDRPATNSTLLTVAAGQTFSTSLLPTAVGNATKVFDVDSALTDTSISGAYIDEIWIRYSQLTNTYIGATSSVTATYATVISPSASVTVTSSGHNLQVGQQIYLTYTSGSPGITSETITITAVTPTTFTGVSTCTSAATGNVTTYFPLDICFYLVSTSSITLLTQFLPLFVASVPAVAASQNYSLTQANVLPLINHPVVQAGSNFTSTNSTTSPKIRGLMLQRGQALYAAVSGATALTNGFYINIQAGFY